jgi:hypothetical protein
MPITITNLERPNNCNHVTISADVDGAARSAHVHVDDVLEIIRNSGLDYRVVLVMCWLKYKRDGGASWASLIGQTVV